jgi:hypothetical protein
VRGESGRGRLLGVAGRAVERVVLHTAGTMQGERTRATRACTTGDSEEAAHSAPQSQRRDQSDSSVAAAVAVALAVRGPAAQSHPSEPCRKLVSEADVHARTHATDDVERSIGERSGIRWVQG